MKAYLLDTHIWIWSLLEPERLSPSVKAVLENPNTELFLSSISIWETLLLCEKKRLEVTLSSSAWVREALAKSPIQEAPINNEIAIISRELKTTHKDPADRFILATARVYNLTLITADKALWNVAKISTLHA